MDQPHITSEIITARIDVAVARRLQWETRQLITRIQNDLEKYSRDVGYAEQKLQSLINEQSKQNDRVERKNAKNKKPSIKKTKTVSIRVPINIVPVTSGTITTSTKTSDTIISVS